MPKHNKNISENNSFYEAALAHAVGARIRTRRKQLKLTQRQIRTRLDEASVSITRTQFSRIENGESLLNVAEVIGLAAALGVSYNWLLDGESLVEKDK